MAWAGLRVFAPGWGCITERGTLQPEEIAEKLSFDPN